MRKAKLGQHGSGSGQSEVFDQVLAKNPEGHDIQEDNTLSSEADDSSFGVEF
jgi:hypothetical protein